jgi:hypothetical protein
VEPSLKQIIPLAFGVILGLMLWIGGRRLARPALAILGLLLGGLLGWFVGSVLGLGLVTWAIAIAAGGVLAFLAAQLERMAITAGLSIILGITAAGSVVFVMSAIHAAREAKADPPAAFESQHPDPPDPWTAGAPKDLIDFLNEIRVSTEPPPQVESAVEADADTDAAEAARKSAARVRALGDELLQAAKEAFAEAPREAVAGVISAAVIGALLGLALGVLTPAFATALMTALLGAALWLGCGAGVAVRLGVPGVSWLPDSWLGWLVLWVVAAVIGLCIQWMLRPKSADKPG